MKPTNKQYLHKHLRNFEQILSFLTYFTKKFNEIKLLFENVNLKTKLMFKVIGVYFKKKSSQAF